MKGLSRLIMAYLGTVSDGRGRSKKQIWLNSLHPRHCSCANDRGEIVPKKNDIIKGSLLKAGIFHGVVKSLKSQSG